MNNLQKTPRNKSVTHVSEYSVLKDELYFIHRSKEILFQQKQYVGDMQISTGT